MRKYEGGCSCGQIRFEIAERPRMVVVCHCNECKKRTGSAFGVSAVFAAADIVSHTGESATYTRTGNSGKEVSYEFCPRCATTVRWQVSTLRSVMDAAWIYAWGAIDDREGLAPTGELYARDKQSWADPGFALTCDFAPDDAFRQALMDAYRER